jgi:hypothetical protein
VGEKTKAIGVRRTAWLPHVPNTFQKIELIFASNLAIWLKMLTR